MREALPYRPASVSVSTALATMTSAVVSDVIDRDADERRDEKASSLARGDGTRLRDVARHPCAQHEERRGGRHDSGDQRGSHGAGNAEARREQNDGGDRPGGGTESDRDREEPESLETLRQPPDHRAHDRRRGHEPGQHDRDETVDPEKLLQRHGNRAERTRDNEPYNRRKAKRPGYSTQIADSAPSPANPAT